MLRPHPFISALAFWAVFPLAGRGKHEDTMAKKHSTGFLLCLGVIHLPGLEVVFGLLRMGEQFSDKEHNFTSWGEPKCRGVYSELHPVSLSRVTFPFSQPVVPLQLGYSHSQASQKSQIFRRCPSWVQDDFFSSDPSNIIHLSLGASPSCEFQSSTDHGSPLLCPAWFPTSCLCFKCFADDPRRRKPKSHLPQKQSLESKQLQLLMSSQGIWALAVKVQAQVLLTDSQIDTDHLS